jgi:hypothetical protein
MDYSSVTNPVYASADDSVIACMVQFSGFAAPIPFNAMASDVHGHGREIYADLVAGKYGPIGAYVPPTPQQQCDATPETK